MIAHHHQVDGQAGRVQRRLQLAHQSVHLELGGSRLLGVRAKFVALVIRFGVVNGDEVRPFRCRQVKQRRNIVDARLLGLRAGFGLRVEVRIPRRPEACDLRL